MSDDERRDRIREEAANVYEGHEEQSGVQAGVTESKIARYCAL